MRKKRILFIILILFLFVALWFVGYKALEQKHIQSQYEGCFEHVKEYIQNDTYFAETYGSPISISSYDAKKNLKEAQVNENCYEFLYLVEIENNDKYIVTAVLDFSEPTEDIYYVEVVPYNN